MKKIFTIIGLVAISLLLSGCSNDSMEDITIYTSVYPIEYVTNELYGTHSKIYNMYPQGIEPYNYEFTEKQISDFSGSDLVIYNGLDNEKDLIVKMIDNNQNLKIIDATNRIDITDNVDEVWINPSNILMISKNIRDGLKEYVTSDLIKEDIDEKYEILKLKISSLDADLKEMAENAKDKNIVVSSNQFLFLKKYGFNVISLDEDTYTERDYNEAKNLIENGVVKYVFMKDTEIENTTIKNSVVTRLRNECSVSLLLIDTLDNINTSDKNEGLNYYTIMNDNLDKLKQELY